MHPRWRRFLLVLTLTATVLVHTARLHQMQAASVAVSSSSSSGASAHAPAAKSANVSPVPIVVDCWTFQATETPVIESHDLGFYLAKNQTPTLTLADIEAASQDLSFFCDTEFGLEEPAEKKPAFRRTGFIASANKFELPAFATRHRTERARTFNYVRSALASNSFAYDLASHGINVPTSASNHPIVRRPQTDDGDGNGTVGGNPTPTPSDGGGDTGGSTGGDDGSVGSGGTGGTGGPIDNGGFGGVGTGGGTLPSPDTEIPEPSTLSGLICIAMLLGRRARRQCH